MTTLASCILFPERVPGNEGGGPEDPTLVPSTELGCNAERRQDQSGNSLRPSVPSSWRVLAMLPAQHPLHADNRSACPGAPSGGISNDWLCTAPGTQRVMRLAHRWAAVQHREPLLTSIIAVRASLLQAFACRTCWGCQGSVIRKCKGKGSREVCWGGVGVVQKMSSGSVVRSTCPKELRKLRESWFLQHGRFGQLG